MVLRGQHIHARKGLPCRFGALFGGLHRVAVPEEAHDEPPLVVLLDGSQDHAGVLGERFKSVMDLLGGRR